ncbi:MAG TPA: D-alanyl-D-alanine carboxypeptidase [Candidatus Binatia bacterium]|nr:D-alanyl-D-alanine carboxypeptidase [Candidatus Binatia bacterium]
MNAQTKKPERRRPLPLLLLVIGVLLFLCWLPPLPKLKAQSSYSYKSHPKPVSLSWPAYGQSAVGAESYGLLDSEGSQVPAPMASVTKVVTAMAVLQKKPLTPGDQGPTITIGPEDVASYNDYSAKGGSVVPVTEGEQISEYQALQALLLPSANNMADTLARWAFGSVNNFTAYANVYLKGLALKESKVADASGFSPQSVSSAEDLTNLGLVFMRDPVLSGIVSQQSADIPVAGTVKNINWLLGTDGIVGIKTGNTEQAGGVYLFAANRNIEGQNILVVGAIMGAPDLNSAIGDSRPLLASVDTGFTKVTVAKKNEILGIYIAPWGNVVNLLSKNDVSIVTWATRQVSSVIKIDTDKTSVTKGQPVGTISAVVWGNKNTDDIIAADNVPPPSFGWRLYKRHV